MSERANRPLVEIRNLREYVDINMGFFRTKPLKAVDNVSFSINRGGTLDPVGESDCGKTARSHTCTSPWAAKSGMTARG